MWKYHKASLEEDVELVHERRHQGRRPQSAVG